MNEKDLLLSAEVEILVPFHDLDPMGVVWHGNYFKYFELARTEIMRGLGFDVEEMKLSGYIWPVVDAQCRYIAPLRYGMRALVRAEILETTHRLKIAYEIKNKESGQRLARGHTVQAAVKLGTWEMCFDTPEVLLNQIKTAVKNRK
jgi:acyl-CoA thioester hydrolase